MREVISAPKDVNTRFVGRNGELGEHDEIQILVSRAGRIPTLPISPHLSSGNHKKNVVEITIIWGIPKLKALWQAL